MVVHSPHDRRLDAVFHALSDRTRRSMLAELSARPASVGELAAPHPMSLQAASKHLRVLERAGLVERRIDGRVHRLSLLPEALRDAATWIAFYRRFWDDSLDRLEALLGEPDPPDAMPADAGRADAGSADAGEAT